ncbi:HAD family acid phosphatase [Terriglobus tenax]|uniref:HAD family acid phosphatase n=1 Tax=Terriglobus tenax TaxID=1111115 RepID=UPI0021E00965|nr:HAD family acid phosphatase [Terriglobus tenax]
MQFRTLLPFLLATSLLAQRPTQSDPLRPPTCPGRAPSSHPTAQQLMETRQQAAHDPHYLIAEPPVPNFAQERYKLADYYDCAPGAGCYWADIDAQYNRAIAVLDQAIATKKRGEKLAIVLDIDETTLSAYCEEKREDFGYIGSMFNQWVVSPEASLPFAGTLRLVEKAQTAGVEIFFLTGRPEDQRAATARNLETAGFHNWKELYLREPGMYTSTIEYKSAQRAKIVAAGYRLVLNIGDQYSDLFGTPQAETSVKLPNPFYYLP